MDYRRRQALKQGLAASTLLGLGLQGARAQAPPDAVRMIIGYPPTGAIDSVARSLSEELTGKLAKTVTVENRPGASGRVAVDIARAAAPDGATLLFSPAGVLTINPHTYRKSSYDPFTDFAPISVAAQIDFGFAVGPAVPAEVKNIATFAAWARANPGQVTYGSPAAGAPPHFVGDVLSRQLGLGMTHVAYRGGTPALTDIYGGQLSALILTLGDLVEPTRAGKLRLLAATGPTRSRFAPSVPTFAEQGVKDLDMRDWLGVFIVGKPTAGTMNRILPIVRAALASSRYAEKLLAQGIEPGSSTPEEVTRLVRIEHERWGRIVKASGFVADT